MEQLFLRPIRSNDRDWLVNEHRESYAENEGFDESFGDLVGEIVDAFLSDHDPDREAGWIAEENLRPLGSIFCTKLSRDVAKLRLFYLVPHARGKGAGRLLLETCMTFAQRSGYSEMQLWTHESHEAVCNLYRGYGWELTRSKPVRSFGQNLVEQSWRYRF